MTIRNTDEIKGLDALQSILADAIDIICDNGGEAIINEMGLSEAGYSALRERIRQYEDSRSVRVNQYGNP